MKTPIENISGRGIAPDQKLQDLLDALIYNENKLATKQAKHLNNLISDQTHYNCK